MKHLVLADADLAILREAVRNLSEPERRRLTCLLNEMADGPAITVGLYGGQVQWVKGNPWPVTVVDYDEPDESDVSFDEEGNPCRIWQEPVDPSLSQPVASS